MKRSSRWSVTASQIEEKTRDAPGEPLFPCNLWTLTEESQRGRTTDVEPGHFEYGMQAESEPEFSTLPWKGEGQVRKPNICSWLEVLTPAIHNRGFKPQEKVKLPSSCLGHCHWSCLLPRGMQARGKYQWKFNFTFLSVVQFSDRGELRWTIADIHSITRNSATVNCFKFTTAPEKSASCSKDASQIKPLYSL